MFATLNKTAIFIFILSTFLGLGPALQLNWAQLIVLLKQAHFQIQCQINSQIYCKVTRSLARDLMLLIARY